MNVFAFNTKRYASFDETQDDLRIARVLPLFKNVGAVLDVGCLDGTIGVRIRNQGNTVCGIDASTTAVAAAQQRGIDARLGNVEERFPFEDEMFDAVFAGEIVEHIFDIDTMLAEIHRVLKPSGFLVVTTPNLAAFGRRMLLLLNRNPNIEIAFTGSAAGHIRYFIKRTLFDILAAHSLKATALTSDVVNFSRRGKIRSCWLARAFPTYGRTLIVKAQKMPASAAGASQG